jgi:hypothetical protein|tara:strand:+ start:53900 stop:55090 length:1191 start_codon:yes stop_codon:yes gene_type:complete
MKKMTLVTGLLGAALFLTAFLSDVQAQGEGDRWLPFIGCWEPMETGEDASLLCFRPEGSGVEMFNVADGEIAATEQLVADGQRRSVIAEGCTGGEGVHFSEDGRRLFTRSRFQCDGEVRSGSGVMSFISPTQWIDVRSLEIGGDPVSWVQRYELADLETLADQGIEAPTSSNRVMVRTMRSRAARDIDIQDVEEAVREINSRAAEVWVAAHETPFELSGSELVRLVDNGVPESVIDVMLAVSYPNQFMVTPEGAAAEAAVSDEYAMRYAPYPGYPGYRGFRSYLWDPLYSPMGYSYGLGYGYSPFGYYGYGAGYGRGFGGYYGYTPVGVVIQQRAPVQQGRMVRGQGYTRGSGGTNSRPASGARPGNNSGGGASADSGAGRSSSGGGSGGRTARRR